MAEYNELVQALTWLLTNRIQEKIEYIHGLLGDGNGRVRVSTTPNSPEVDYVYVRPDRFSNRTYKVFNKRIEGQDGDPVIIGELPWEPGLIQVVDMDWAAYADVGWGDDVTTTNRHGISHQWRDGAPGIDTFNVYRRQFGDLKTYPAVSGTLAVGVSPYSLDLYGNQYQWPGAQSFSLSGALPAGTGTARMVLVYWDLSSGTTQGFLGIATGTVGSSADATILNRPITPTGAIPSAFVRLKGGQTSVSEFDIWDAREPFRPGILFGTGTTGLSADLIPISDTSGLYTGSTVEAALDQIGFDGARVSKVYESDFGGVALQSDADGKIGIGTATPTYELDVVGNVGINEFLYHNDDPDSYLQWSDDRLDVYAGGLNMLRLTETTQDLVEIGDVAGGGDVDVNINNGQVFVQGSDGFFGVGTITPSKLVEMKVTSGFADFKCASTDAAGGGRFEFESGDGGANSIAGQFGSSYVAVSEYANKMVFQTFGRDIALSAYDTGDEIHFYTGGRTSAFRRVTIDSTGQVGIKTSTPSAQLHVDQTSTTAAIPVLYLDQADVSEEMIEFNTTIGTGNAIEAVGAKTLTTTHFIKVTLPGALTRYLPVGTIA